MNRADPRRDMRRLEVAEAADAARRAASAFGGTVDDASVERWRERIATGDAWALQEGDQVLAQCRLLRAEHWFGGRPVPSCDVASLAVPPEHRGKGAARALMKAAVEHGARAQAGLSLLFPATTRMYRSLGWEHAGVRARYRVDARQVPADGPAMRTADRQTDWAAIRDCHDRAMRQQNGPAVRRSDRWETLRKVAYHYVLDAADRPGTVEAYALVNHRQDPGAWQYTLAIVDWGATTPRGLRAVLALVGRHGTVGKDATFLGPFPDPWSQLVAEQDVALDGHFFWMARGLDLPAAVSARGFPSSLAVSVTFRVDDPLLPDQHGPWRLEIAGGRGRLASAHGADVRLQPAAFGPLFTGFRSPVDLAMAGLLTGPGEALELLAAAFAGSPPVAYDFF